MPHTLAWQEIALQTQPTVEETIGGQEIYCDGWVLIPRGEIITGVLYVERTAGRRITRHEIVRLHFGCRAWFENQTRTMQMIEARLARH